MPVSEPISEMDQELLEMYLDGAVEGYDAVVLGRRLANEAGLATALEEARAQRMVRQAVWKTIDPDQASADRLSWRIRGAMLAQVQNTPIITPASAWNLSNIARVSSAAAACIVVGFLIGRVGRSGAGAITGQSTAIVSNGPTDSIVQTPQSQFHQTGTVAQVMVPITNEYGQVVQWQRFDNADEAKSFEEDLHRTHEAGQPDTGQPGSPANGAELKLASQTETHF